MVNCGVLPDYTDELQQTYQLVAPSFIGLDPEELLKDAKLVWHRQERIENKY